MRTESFHADDLARLLRRNKIATMSELKKALGTQVEVTVFRKLKQLSYRSSYSHRSRYYTLDEIARFDPRGLWSFQSVWFSRQGTLVATAEAFVENSAAGHFVEELDNLLHVSAKEPLLKLVRQQRLARQPLGGTLPVRFDRSGPAPAPVVGAAAAADRTEPGQQPGCRGGGARSVASRRGAVFQSAERETTPLVRGIGVTQARP